MKKLEAVVRPMVLDAVKDALTELGLQGMTVTDVRGYGRQRGRTEKYRGNTYMVNLLPKVKIELVVPDDQVDAAIEAIIVAARTGEIGDGKVFTSVVEQALRIRTGERDADAL